MIILKVLLVEDCQSVAEVVFDYFEGSDFELDYAATGTLGLELAKNEPFDCLVLDITELVCANNCVPRGLVRQLLCLLHAILMKTCC